MKPKNSIIQTVKSELKYIPNIKKTQLKMWQEGGIIKEMPNETKNSSHTGKRWYQKRTDKYPWEEPSEFWCHY